MSADRFCEAWSILLEGLGGLGCVAEWVVAGGMAMVVGCECVRVCVSCV